MKPMTYEEFLATFRNADIYHKNYDNQRAYNSLCYIAKWLYVANKSFEKGHYDRAKRQLCYALDSAIELKSVDLADMEQFKELWKNAKKQGEKQAKELIA